MAKITKIYKGGVEYEMPQGQQGIQGPQGETCAYDPDDPETPVFQLATTTGDSQTKCMTQKAVTDELNTDRVWSETAISMTGYEGDSWKRKIIDSNGKWQSEGAYSGFRVPINASSIKHLKITAHESQKSTYAFLTANPSSPASNTAAPFVEGTSLVDIPANTTVYVDVPATTVCIWFLRKRNNVQCGPQGLYKVVKTREHIESIDSSITTISGDVAALDEVSNAAGFDTEQAVPITWDSSGYVSTDDIIALNAQAHYSNAISLAKGDLLIVKTACTAAFAVIAEKVGSRYQMLVRGDSSLTTYAYLAKRAMSVIISTWSANSCTAKVRRKAATIRSALHTDIIKAPVATPYNVLAEFDNLVTIGDSLTYGVVYTAASLTKRANRPWPKVLAKLCGFDNYTIYATGGKNAQEIWTEYKDSFAVPSSGKTICVIFLGTNGGLTDTLSIDCPTDAASYLDWADTKTGAYAKIVQKFKDLGAKILLIKPWASGADLTTCNAVIDQIATRFGCATVNGSDIYARDVRYHTSNNYRNALHFNGLGYAYFASALIHAVGLLDDENLLNLEL